MLSIFKDRREYVTIKRHLESTFEEQYWAKDSLAKAFSTKLKGETSNLMIIGPKGCGKKSMIIEISKFHHVPILIINAHEMEAYVFNPEYYISMKLLEHSKNDIEKASAGIVVLCNVNHFQLELQRSIARLMSEHFSINVHDVLKNRCPTEHIDKNFSFENVMFIATIDCDIEGKIARRFVHDVIDRKIDRSNAIKIEDLVKLNVCQELAKLFNFTAPFHAKYHQLLATPFCQI
ncbi:ATP-dependent Clp protease ATP-binding subunit ClpX 1-like [Chironomus tepperi]|uniref:ATP-dependent Clp protease ATP-binding subunit ClpX 1-like n=1 Tax=Chironomus tepperi TaxID=113505 RepID=UPI00391F2022